MKSFITVFILLIASSAWAQTNDSLIIKLKNGTTVSISVAVIESIKFDSAKSLVDFQSVIETRFQCSPNPMNEKTGIVLPSESDVPQTLQIHDAYGRLILSESIKPSEHQFYWYGRDREQNPVPNGAYFISLSRNDEVLHQKVIVIR
jgi:hypothetical protein